MKDDRDFSFGFGVVVGLFLGATIVFIASINYWHREMIDRNYAEYNQKTGAWQWKTNLIVIENKLTPLQ